jgi:peptide/nickel transport system substrate-binding protein
MRGTTRLLAAGLAAALVLAGCSGSEDTEDDQTADEAAASETDGGGGAAAGGEITIALGSEPTTLDPQLREDGGERAVNDNVYETLMARTPEGDLVPGLAAEEPTQIDDTTWEFKLQEGVTFHNGEPFNADSVVHSLERIIDPDFASEQASFVSTVEGAEAVDEYTVHVTTSGPDPLLPTRMYWTKMVPLEASEEDGFADEPVGTGPYQFSEWVKGDHVTLERYSDYWGDNSSNVESVTYRFISEPSTRLSALLADEINLMTNLLPEDVERAPKAESVQGVENPIMILNATGGVTEDPRVRQAMNYAVDKEALADDLFEGYASVAQCQIMSPQIEGYNDSLEGYPYDPEQAQELLAEAGAEGASVQIVGTSGRWLKDRETVETVAAYLNEVGLQAQPEIFEFDEYLNRLFGEVRPDSVYVTSSNELFDADRQLSAYYQLDGVGDSNEDEELDGWVDQAREETDPEARQELYDQATQKACDEAYFLFLLHIEDIYGMSEDLDWQPRVDAKMLVKDMQLG